MNSRKLKLLIGASVMALAGCGGGGDSGGSPSVPPVVVIPGQGTLETMFGVGFGALFRGDPNSDPSEPQDSDVIALTLVADPVPVP